MTYRAALAWLYSTQLFGIKLGLENIRGLLKSLGDPQRRLSFLHVAGTNGKGSVCAMLDAILRAADRRVGLYTSPHLVDFRERIRVDGVKIPPRAAANGLSSLREISVHWNNSPTFSNSRQRSRCIISRSSVANWSCWKLAWGGALDATNAVVPVVSIITPIALDHMKWLGSTLPEIAQEKQE